MSHHSTPHMNSKRTPGQAAETPNGSHLNMAVNSSMNSSSSPASLVPQPPITMNSSRSVSDRGVTNARQLLNAYIYEFLIKNTLPETAKTFVAEADLPSVPMGRNSSNKTSPMLINRPESGDKENGSASNHTTPQTPAMSVAQFAEENNLPGLALSMDAPQGFLFEWWQVFWDVYQAKNSRPNSASMMAEQYYQIQVMKQKQADPFGADPAGPYQSHPSQNVMLGAPMGGSATGQMMANMSQQTPLGPSGPMTQVSQQQMQRLQGSQPPPNMDPRQQRYMMQMMMKQQQFQQSSQLQQQKQQQNLGPNQGPNHSQNQGQNQGQNGQNHGQPPNPQSLNQLPQHHPNQPPSQSQPPHNHQHMPLQQQQTPHQTPQQTPLQTPPVNQMPRQAQPYMQGMEPPMANMAMNMKQPVYVQQQGMSQAQNRIQQQAQTQMNNLRQQAAVAQQQGQGPAAAAVAAVAAAAAAAANPHARDGGSPANVNMMNGQRVNQARPRQMPLHNMGGMQVPFQGNMANGAMSPPYVTGNVSGNGHNMQMNAMNQNVQPGRNSNALQDYQMQLMVLERQNKKRLDIARSNGTTESPVAMSQMHQPQMNNLQKMPPAPSPRMANHASPGTNGPKAKKEPVKRGQNGPNSVITPQSAGTDAGGVNGRPGGGQVKRERNAPLTPAAETEGGKKKRKAGDSPKKPKTGAGAKKEKPTPKTKHAEEPKVDAEANNGDALDSASIKMPPPNGAFFQPTLGSVEMINAGAGANGEVNFFSAGGNSSIDDIDFDFNSFLDGGDEGLNDGLSGFNWGNPIEGD